MATTIRSTALDFANIKANLIEELKAKQEFEDYDFEASGLSNILDVLSYNTHVNGLVANFTLNESFLGTAQLRSSVVSLATSLGYIPDTKTSARGLIRASVNLSGADTAPSVIQMPAYTRFTSIVDDITYTFQTIETYSAENDGNGLYTFVDANGSTSIPVYEGLKKTKNFLVGKFSANDAYIIPDLNMDGDTVTVNVYDTPGGSSFTPFTNIVDATSVNENSTLYILKEAPNEFFQLSFGANDILGKAPKSGNAIVVDYISTSGPVANAAQNFRAVDGITLGDTTYQISATTVSRAAGGDEKETIESIRRNAPFQYATQNRMVTPEDYTSIILRNFSTLIKDIKSWGGQDNPQPKFGTVFSSILFEDNVTVAQQTETKTAISELVDQLAVISFKVEFADPVDTFIENDLFFQINPKLTPNTVNTVQQNVKTVIANYFDETIGGFNKSFRRSALLSLVDDVSPAILSSRANIKIQQRIVPVVNAKNKANLQFPVTLRAPDDEDPIITSSSFQVAGQTVRIENKLKSNTLQIKAIGSGDVVVDNIGSYNALTGSVEIVSFKPNALLGGVNFIKISAIPANQSAITPLLNEILKFDEDISRIVPVTISAQN